MPGERVRGLRRLEMARDRVKSVKFAVGDASSKRKTEPIEKVNGSGLRRRNADQDSAPRVGSG